MAIHVISNTVVGADNWYDLSTGDAFILTNAANFFSSALLYQSGLFGMASAPGVIVSIGGTMGVEHITLFGGDRVLVGQTGTVLMGSTDGITLTSDFAVGQTTFVNQGSIFSHILTGAKGITAQLAGGVTDEGVAINLTNAGHIDAKGIAVQLIGATNGALVSGVVENFGSISGSIAIDATGAADSVLNHGQMTGTATSVIHLAGSTDVDFAPYILNDGTLTFTGRTFGRPLSAAISVTRGDAVTHSEVEIENSGRINGHGRAIYLDVDTATISNRGTISGAITSTGGAVTIVNLDGAIRGNITLGAGADTLVNGGNIVGAINMGAGDDTLDLRGGRILGNQVVTGGDGGDTYLIDSISVQIVESATDTGIDTVLAGTSFRLRPNFENLTLLEGANLDGTGNLLNNVIIGNASNNWLAGAQGNDSLSGSAGDDTLQGGIGNDTLLGGNGEDMLNGGIGVDLLYGNNDSDTFIFSRTNQLGLNDPDTIGDFVRGDDLIMLTGIDANTVNAISNDVFSFIGTAAFSNVAGQLRYEIIGAETFIRMDVNGDGAADFAIRLLGAIALTATDFAL